MRVAVLVVVVIVLIGCAPPPPDGDGPGEGEGEGEGEAGPTGFDVDVDADEVPCERLEAWPILVPSPAHPWVLHLRDESERALGDAMMADLDLAWDQERALGFPDAPGDEGVCGDDGLFDVFLFAGSERAYVDSIADIPATPFNDVAPFLVIDYEFWPPSTMAHELNHAMQASCDWNETAFIFEATSQFIEEALFDDDDIYREVLVDFQSQADRALDFDDGYAGYYMYGAALYLFYLDEAVFSDDPTWLGRMWLGARSTENPAGLGGEPDVEDVLEDMLQEQRSMSFFDSVVEFARWRYYLAGHDDGRHFSEAAELLDDALVPELSLAVGGEQSAALSELGTLYLALSGAADGDVHVTVGGELDGATLIAQALPGLDGSDGQRVDGSNVFTVRLSSAGTRVLALTLLPPPERADPDVVERPRRPLSITASTP